MLITVYGDEGQMKLLAILLCSLFALAAFARAATDTQTFSTSGGPVKITPLYHASTLIEAGGKTIYLDPAKPAKLSGLPKADLILITHIHPDHMDPDSIKQVSKPETEILAPPTVVQTVTSAKPITNGETKTWQGWTIEAVPAYNLKRGPAPGTLFHPKGRDNGYVLTYGGKRFYFSADTEGTPEMRALKNIDVAFVRMNLPYTMPPR
jgi:L-ascorbate metabolism protein UlaG (beta-lactamase superfamily)